MTPNVYPAIIDQDTFNMAQAILEKGKTGNSPYTEDDNPFLFTRKLRCGLCESTLWAEDPRLKYYECSQAKSKRHGNCDGCRVTESKVLEELADHLENWLGLDGDRLGTAAHYNALKAEGFPEAFAELKTMVARRAKPKPKRNRERMAKQAEQLKTRAAKMVSNLYELDAEFIPGAQEKIRQLNDQRREIEQELRQSDPPSETGINQVAIEVFQNLSSLCIVYNVFGR